MESWPGSLVLTFEGTACLINMESEAPLLESWMVASSAPAAAPLAGRLAEAQDAHVGSTEPETQLAIDLAEVKAILDALDAHREDVDDHRGLLNLRKTLSTLEV